jgi:Rrf2 family transcriptional regulator, iron-sulfur cluster assembly transcription factor
MYAFRALRRLAGSEGNMTASELAESCDIPRSFAYKILQRLSRSGIVASRTGRLGGFRLAVDPKKISLIDVISSVQGPICASRCLLEPGFCSASEECSVASQWREIQGHIIGFLNRNTLEDVLRPEPIRAGGVN